MKSIEESMLDSVKSNSLRDLTLDAGEVVMDSMLDDGIAKDVPVFGILVKGYDAYRSTKEKLFARKIYKFLREIGSTAQAERIRVMEEIAEAKGGLNAAGVAVLELVDKLDSDRKPELVGKLFNACGAGHISVGQYLRLADLISKIYLDDLLLLADPHPGGMASAHQKNIFLAHGLMTFSLRNPQRKSAQGASMLQIAADIYDTKFEFDYVLTADAARISKYCFNLDRWNDSGIEGFAH